MLFDLLKRDLKLHWDLLVLPYLILALLMGALSLAAEGAAVAGAITMGSLFVPFLPMAIHLREQSQGTLGDLLALPVRREALVSLRYLEFGLFTGLVIVLAHGGTWLAQSAAARRAVRLQIIDGPGAMILGLLLLFCFAYPVPFCLRWDGKGLVGAYVLLSVVLVGPGWIFPKAMEAFAPTFLRFIQHLVAHPGQVALGFLALLLFSYLISLKAFGTRDF